MTGLRDPIAAREFVLERLQAEAAQQKRAFTSFELKLLAANMELSDEEVEQFDEIHGEEFIDRTNALLGDALLREQRAHGWFAYRRLRKAIKQSAKLDDYFSLCLILNGFAPLKQRTAADNFLFLSEVLFGIALLCLSITYSDLWVPRVRLLLRPLKPVADWMSSHLPIIERYGGVVYCCVVVAVAVGALVWQWRHKALHG